MIEWIRENFSWISMLIIVGVVKVINGNFWLIGYPVSIFLAVACLGALTFLSFCYIRFFERILLIAAYVWVCWNIIKIFAGIYMKFGIFGADLNVNNTLYLSISVWTLLGFGQILPSEASRYWVQIEAIMGLLTNGVLLALLFRLFAPWHQLAKPS